jgi:hypothetical protein
MSLGLPNSTQIFGFAQRYSHCRKRQIYGGGKVIVTRVTQYGITLVHCKLVTQIEEIMLTILSETCFDVEAHKFPSTKCRRSGIYMLV